MKYWLFIYRQGRAQAMKLKVGMFGQEISIRKVRSGAQTCCGLYESNNRENNGLLAESGRQWALWPNQKEAG